jgi:hypothetical protein
MLRKRRSLELANEKGQALVEFIMLVPLIMTFAWYLVHINLAINKSIVGQKHARSQLFLKMYNHRSGPIENDFGKTQRSHFYVGVSGTTTTDQPEAPTEKLGIGPKPKDNPDANNSEGEASLGSLRQSVRIRTVFGICTHRKVIRDTARLTDFCGSEPESK